MSRIAGSPSNPRRRSHVSRPWSIEALEPRIVLADGISASAAPPIHAVAGVPLVGAIFATYTVTNPSGVAGMQWRALINFGDGQVDGPIIPVEKGAEFEFIDTHAYRSPGTYTVTVMIALPGSMKPNDNTVTTQVIVTGMSGSLSPHPVAMGLRFNARQDQTFLRPVADFRDPGTRAQQLQATIDWGDQSTPTPGRIEPRGSGRFAVIGTHRYSEPGIFRINVSIRDAAGQAVIAESAVHVKRLR
jgi:hypothetical protein